MGALSLDQPLPRREAYGTEGRPVVLRTNYFNLTLRSKSQLVYRYDVQVEPSDGVSRKKVRRYMELLLEQAIFTGINAVTDYSTIVITDAKLKLLNDPSSFQITIHERPEEPFPAPTSEEAAERRTARTKRTRTLKIRYATPYSIDELFSFAGAQSQPTSYTAKGDVVQALNIILSGAANKQNYIANAGQNKFYPYEDVYGNHQNYERQSLRWGLLALRGYYSSVRVGPQRVLVNLNVSSGAFYEPGPINQLMDNFLQGKDKTNSRTLRELSAFIKGLKVVTRHVKEKNHQGEEVLVRKVRSVLGLATSPRIGANCQEIKFSWTNAAGVSAVTNVEQYFKQSMYLTFQIAGVTNDFQNMIGHFWRHMSGLSIVVQRAILNTFHQSCVWSWAANLHGEF